MQGDPPTTSQRAICGVWPLEFDEKFLAAALTLSQPEWSGPDPLATDAQRPDPLPYGLEITQPDPGARRVREGWRARSGVQLGLCHW